MYSLFFTVVVAVTSVSPTADALSWMHDYGQAIKVTRLEQRPLLLMLDNPSRREWRVRRAKLWGDETQAELLKHYTLCYVDVTTPYGRRVAKAFQVSELPQTTIIDTTGSSIIFQHTGHMNTIDWVSALVSHRSGVVGSQRRPVSARVCNL